MKKTMIFIAVLAIFLSAYAGVSDAYQMNSTKALSKFSRGLTNLVTCPGEYVYQVPKAMGTSPDYLTGFFMTLGRGTGYMLLRASAGLYDVLTFPFPGATNYQPVMQPETIFEKVADATTN